jgi:hypothetical protein
VSADDPLNFVEWWQSLPLPWLVSGPVGKSEATAKGMLVDAEVSLIKEAIKAHMPTKGPTDALPHIGGDRQLEAGPTETTDNFRVRLRTAWDDWARAGQAVELLTQLYWTGFPGAVLVQQNGLAYSLSAAPTAGVDPTSLLVTTVLGGNPNITQGPGNPIVIAITTGGALGTMAFTWSYNGGATSAPVTSTAGGTTFLVPGTYTRVFFDVGTYVLNSTYTFAGDGTLTVGGGGISTVTQNSAPWWTFDINDYFCSRFAVLFPTGGGAFTTSGVGTFSETDTAVVTWSNPFPDTTYAVQVGAVNSTDPVSVVAVSSSKTQTTVTLQASGPFTGTVDVLAWQQEDNPFADPHPADLARLRRIIDRWRPKKATPVGLVIFAQGKTVGWPVRNVNDGGTVGPSSIVSFTV